MTYNQLDSLYCGLCDLLESCTPQEMGEYRNDILNVKQLIIQKQQSSRKNYGK